MQQLNKNDKLVITGAAGLLGQNLVTELIQQGYVNITALDKDKKNLDILKQLHPQVNCVPADLSKNDDWKKAFEGAVRLFLLQAQITGAEFMPFQKNTVDSTKQVIDAARSAMVPFTIFIIADFPRSVNAQFAKKGAFPKKFYALSQTLLHNPAHFVYNHNTKNC